MATVPKRTRRAALLCCHFTRNLAYYRAGWRKKNHVFPTSDLWATLNSNFLDIAAIEWCKVFAETKAFHNWRKVVVDPDSFLPQLISDFGASKNDWDRYLGEMRTYRDKFVAHLDRKNTMHIPSMDFAQFAIRYIYDTMRAEQITQVFNGLPQDLAKYSHSCTTDAVKLYESAT